MLSVRNGGVVTDNLGLVMDGKGSRRRRGEMERREPGERESFSGQEDDVDPDALSYIDEKIQHVLGHFQKEFQGGVSTDTLGAQFGGYGSFLPSSHYSPSISSQPKGPMKLSNHTALRSLYNSEPKDGHHNPSVAGTTSIRKVSTSVTGKVTEMFDKREVSVGTHTTDGISPSLNKSLNISDQKMLKLRINIGRDNKLARSKPEIYSDLGLDISPSPSPEDTPHGSEGCSPESPDAFQESPTTILQIMTCFSVPGGFLSPLPNRLLHSNGKEDILPTKFTTRIRHDGQTEACSPSSDTSLNIKHIRSSTCIDSKSSAKNQMLREADDLPDMCDKVEILSKKNETETTVSQSIITTALDMPNTSHSMLEGTREKGLKNNDLKKETFKGPDNASLEERVSDSDVSKCPLVNIRSNLKLKVKSTSAIKPLEESIGNNQGDSYAKAEMGCKASQNYGTIKVESNSYGGRKNYTTEHKESVNNNSAPKGSSCGKDPLISIQGTCPAYEGGIVCKGSPRNDRSLAEPSKDNLSIRSKLKNEMSKIPKLHKGDANDNAIEPHNGLSVSARCQEVDDNKHTFSSSRFIKKSKEKLQLKIANSVTDASVVASLTTNSTTSGSPATISSPSTRELWASCDLCQKWRLLPFGTKPDDLPDEWQCSMQVWLPGFSKCCFSEEETVKAFLERYQVPAPVNVANLTVHPGTALSGTTSSDIINHNSGLENSLVGKKKHRLLNSSNLPNDLSLSYLSNSGKNIQTLSGNKILKDKTESMNLQRTGQQNRSVNHTMKKRNHIVEEPSKILASCSNEGALFENCGEQSMSKSKRKINLDGHCSSKKIKKDSLHLNEKAFHNEDPRAARKVLQISGNQNHSVSKSFRSLPPVTMLKEDVIAFSGGERKKHVSASDTENPDKCDSKVRKRDLKELQVCGTHSNHSMISQQIANNCPMIEDGSSESELRRQKKAKVVKSEEQHFDAGTNGKVDKKGCWTRNKLSKGHALECMDAIKRDVANVEPVAAATSTSSIVSGYQKNKIKIQEVRGSPEESVSSSPMRISNITNRSRYLLEKDDVLNISPVKGIPKNTSDRQEKNGWCSQKAPSVTEINLEQYHLDAISGGASKSPQRLRKPLDLNGTHCSTLLPPSTCATQCSPVKKNMLTTVNAFIQEARALKHTAHQLKSEGLEQKSSGIFFEASLKFLHVASLMESLNTEKKRQGDWFPAQQMLHMYLETARLCEFSAHEYENLKEMTAAALGYKCAEVAYMKVAYFRHPCARKDRLDLEAALNAELPDNQGGFEKAASATATGPPQIAGDLVLSTQNRSHLKRLLTYTNYLNCAFEAAKKSRDAVAAAAAGAAPSKHSLQSLRAVRKVVDFNFNNVEGLLELVRTALSSASSKV